MQIYTVMGKNPSLQDSPPAANCFRNKIPLCHSVNLPGKLFIKVKGKREVRSVTQKAAGL